MFCAKKKHNLNKQLKSSGKRLMSMFPSKTDMKYSM